MMAYDQQCYALAKEVLSHAPEINDEVRRADLAQNIQDEIEAWLSCELFTGDKIAVQKAIR
jgi:hypothetical protein